MSLPNLSFRKPVWTRRVEKAAIAVKSLGINIVALGPVAFDMGKKALDLVLHFFGLPCIGH